MVKAHQISFIAFIALIIASAVILGLFYCVGYDNMEGKYTAPEHTGTLMYWMYIMTAICVVAAVIGGVANALASFGGPKGVNITGVPTTAISVVSMIIMVGSIVVAYLAASPEPLVMPNGKIFDNTSLLVLTDTCIYAIYALMAFTALGLIINLTGIFKK